jgi:hypothetical protein
MGQDRVFGIATCYGLDGFYDRIPVGVRFSAPVQTGPGTYPASYTIGTGSFPGVKRSERGVDHPFPFSAEVKERVELFLYSPSGPSWPVRGRTLHFRYFIRSLGEKKRRSGVRDFEICDGIFGLNLSRTSRHYIALPDGTKCV